MQYVGRLVSSVYNTITPNINPATLSGAIDVIVVERQVEIEVEEENEWGEEGEKRKKKVMTTELASSPFHVRFGKMSVLRPAERKVTLHLNNSPDPLPFAMKVGEAGEAFFVLELGEDEANGEIPDDLFTSPIISATSSPTMAPEGDGQDGEKNQARKDEEELEDRHRAPRKFIEEDYVEPLDLGASRAATSHYLNSDLESRDASTVRSGETRASVDTGLTSPSSTSGGEVDQKESPAKKASDSTSGQASGVLESIETAASKASGAIGAAGRSVIPSMGSSQSRNAKLEKMVNKEQKGSRFTEEGVPVGANEGEREEGKSAREYESAQTAEGVSKMLEKDDESPPEDSKSAKTEMEKLEAQMRDRAQDLVTTTMQAQEEKQRAESTHSASPRSLPEQKGADKSADLMEESYPAPFGSGSIKTASARTETGPTTQPDHVDFLGGKKLEPVESGLFGKGDLNPAQVDSRTVRERLRKWEEEKRQLDEREASTGADKGQEKEEQVEDEDVATKGPSRKEDLQYMLDMDGYKMTADGEDLAFAEGNRFSDELPLGKKHGGNGRHGHNDLLNYPHQHTLKQLDHQTTAGKTTLVRRGSLGDAHLRVSSAEVKGLKRRGSHSAATSDSGGPSSFDGEKMGQLLHFGEASGGERSDKERDALNLSRDLVRLTRSLRPGGEDGEADEVSKRRPSRRQRAHEASLSDTEAEPLGDSSRSQTMTERQSQGNSGGTEMGRSSSGHGRHHQRATSEEPSSWFGEESIPVVREDAALGRSPDYEWGWGQLPRRESSGASQSTRRQRILSNPEMPDDGLMEGSRGSKGRLTCDDRDPYLFVLELEDASHHFELSLCYVEGNDRGASEEAGEQTDNELAGGSDEWMEHFEENKVSYQRFLDDEDVVNDERVVVRYNERFLTWENASAVLATLSLYRKTLSMTQQDGQPSSSEQGVIDAARQGQSGSVWRRWWNRSKETVDEEMGQTGDRLPPGPSSLPRPLDRAHTDSILEAKVLPAKAAGLEPSEAGAGQQRRRPKTYAKTLRLTSDQLKSLNLRKGANTITFSVTSSYSGVATCSARIFLWDGSHQIVVSDIDGTITKSDALGHVFTMIGRDWTHVGVAKLYTDIARNGYRIMYLTSRAIGQADTTRDYLKGISQSNYKLPDGPVIMSPDRLMASLHREVILRKPEVFKMACLRDIARLFGADPRHALPQPGNEWPNVGKGSIMAANGPGAGKLQSPADGAATKSSSNQHPTPFYAGFGNRITDALSYRSVNIPSSRIFTIDSNGEVKMELLELAGYKSSYIHMTDLVDQMFPPITLKSSQGNIGKPEFNDFNYWRPNIGQFELPSDDELMPSPSASSPASPALSARSGASGTIPREEIGTSATMDEAGLGSGGGSRLSRFGLGKLGLNRKGSSQTIVTPSSLEEGSRKTPSHSATMPALNSVKAGDGGETSASTGQDYAPTPSSPSSYGSGVTSWAAGWRRRAASPGANSNSSVQATSPLVGPVITAEPDDEESGEGEEDDDVSSFGDDDREGGPDDDQGGAGNMGDEVLEDDDPLLATGEIQFEWRG